MKLIDIDNLLSTSSKFRGIWSHVRRARRYQLFFLLLVSFACSGAELLSLSSIFPFLAVLSDPHKLERIEYISNAGKFLGISNPNELLILVACAFAFVSLLAASVRVFNLWLNGRLAASIGFDLSCEAYRRTLYQPYTVHLQRNSSSIIVGISTHLNRTVAAITAVLQIINGVFVSAGLLLGLFLVDWGVTLVLIILFGSIYALLAVTINLRLGRNSKKIANAMNSQLKALQEGLGAIRDILLDNSQHIYLEVYENADRVQRNYQAQNVFLAKFPRFAIEAIGLVVVSLLGVFLVRQAGQDRLVLPLLGVFALGSQRLLPAFQQIYGNWSTLKSFDEDLLVVLKMLEQEMPSVISYSTPWVFRDRICLSDVQFSYTKYDPNILSGFNLEIRRGERVGIVGPTGSGKSTVLDLLMGLLEPAKGLVSVDGLNLHETLYPDRVKRWQAAIAHVPQDIYLADCSIAENIAFGKSPKDIDMNRVIKAAQQAQISEYIESMADGYNSFVGERGVRLSGGQRQRIGIARALYKQASVLLFDEATSALDNQTELALVKAIEESLSSNLTVIMVAHRLSSLSFCDRIIDLRKL